MRYKRCYYYATKADHKDLVDFISTLNLTVLPAFIGDNPVLDYDDWLIEKTLRYLTYKDAKNVITHRSKYDKPQRDYYSHAGDALIRWKLGYLNEPKQYLVIGTFEWIVLDQYSQDDVHTAETSKEIGKHWRKIDRWIRKSGLIVWATMKIFLVQRPLNFTSKDMTAEPIILIMLLQH